MFGFHQAKLRVFERIGADLLPANQAVLVDQERTVQLPCSPSLGLRSPSSNPLHPLLLKVVVTNTRIRWSAASDVQVAIGCVLELWLGAIRAARFRDG